MIAETTTNQDTGNAQASEDLSITDWLQIGVVDGLTEPELLDSYIRNILGKNEQIEGSTPPRTQADELARLLVTLRNETQSVNSDDPAERTLDRAIELCFLRTSTYRAALTVWKLEQGGEIPLGVYQAGIPDSSDSLGDALTSIIAFAWGKKERRAEQSDG